MSAFVLPSAAKLFAPHSYSADSKICTGSLRASCISSRQLLGGTSPATHTRSVLRMNLEEEDVEDRAQIQEKTKLFVGNLAWATTDASLKEAFSRFGDVVDARVITDHYTGRSRGFGFIEYDAAADAEQALEGMNGVDIDGRNVRVDRANRQRRFEKRENFY